MQLHHVEMCVNSAKPVLRYFAKLGFTLSASSKKEYCKQYMISNRKVALVVTQGPDVYQKELAQEWSIPALSLIGQRGPTPVDTVFNVALEVDNVEELTTTMCKNGGRLLKAPGSSVSDEHGSVTYAMVKTGFGNIIHTLLNKKSYRGQFLPGFQQREICEPSGTYQKLTGDIDHITYACHSGEMDAIIEWYDKCLGLKRHYINSQDDSNSGMVIGENIGIRLKAAKTAVRGNERPLLLVLAEPLTNKRNNHVITFLEAHGGPGLEHIAFQTDNMITTLKEMCKRGVAIKQIPSSYYKMIQNKYASLGQYCNSTDLQAMQDYGILFDEETNDAFNQQTSRYLFQAFTPPIFDQPTFFLEFINRQGAKGLGTNNVWNIMKALEADKDIRDSTRF